MCFPLKKQEAITSYVVQKPLFFQRSKTKKTAPFNSVSKQAHRRPMQHEFLQLSTMEKKGKQQSLKSAIALGESEAYHKCDKL